MLLGISSENRVDPNGNRICVSYPQECEEAKELDSAGGIVRIVTIGILVFAILAGILEMIVWH